MLTDSIPANDVRVPEPKRGRAVLVTRYGDARVKAVILHPDDFATVEALVDAYAASPPSELELSEVALRGHALTDARESDDDYDYDGLAAALGE